MLPFFGVCRMISKTAEYALRAVMCMAAESERPLSADALAERTRVPRRYQTRVMQQLVASGVVDSRSGPGGGYILARPIDTLTILDVIDAVSPLERITTCPLGLDGHTSLCALHVELDRAYAALEAAFARMTLKRLLESANPIVPLCETT